ncbi:MAG: sugar phosphate isomerase/epimerase [Lachnospiraceae bacterium]|nr:sugar phosphate isomerase/epimerase [Lachnospiraceae bacterium]
MQLGIRLHDIKKAPLEERLQIAHEQGFKCGHIALSKVISEYPVDDAALTPGLGMYLKKQFAKYDLDVAVLGCYLNLANPNEETMKKTYNRYFANIRFASFLGAGVVGTETGAVNEEYRFEEENHSDKALRIFIDRVKPVIRCAEEFGVIFAIEPVFKHIVCDPERARKVLDEVGSPNLKIIFDPVNLLDVSNIDRREEIFAQAMDLLGEDIAVLHLKDYVVENGGLKSVACGTGEMQYEELLRFVKEKKPNMHATLENTVPDNAVKTREFIQGIYDRL